MAWSVAVSGLCVGIEWNPYDFTGEDGKRVQGTSCLMAISEAFDSEPIRVKVPQALHAAVGSLEPYSPVEVEANLFAKVARGSAFIEGTARRIVAVDAKNGKRTDLATGEALAPVGS